MRPARLTPVEVLAQRHPHGTRVRYVTGCHCVECRAANTRYEHQRQLARIRGDWNGLVPAGRARAHILSLARAGVGYRQVASSCDVSRNVLRGIKTGRKKKIRARTEKAILSVAPWHRADGSTVSAKPTWFRIRRLLQEGYTQTAIAKLLGYSNSALQFNLRRVTARNALRVEKLYRRLTA